MGAILDCSMALYDGRLDCIDKGLEIARMILLNSIDSVILTMAVTPDDAFKYCFKRFRN